MLSALPALAQTREDNNAANSGVVGQPVFLDGVHVGTAVQDHFQLGLRYEPFRWAYIRPSFLLFTKCYVNFQPRNHSGPTSRTDSYRRPTSCTLGLHLGYNFKPPFK